MWMGELITQRGIGNGISLMIFASIVSRIPSGVQSWWNSPDQSFKVMMPFIVFAVVAGIVFVQTGQRRIPVQYAKRVIGKRMPQGGQTYIPLTVNMANVIPVIFAATVMSVPPTIGQLIGQNKIHNWGTNLATFLSPGGWHYVVGECILIVALHLLLHGGRLQPDRPGREPEEVRRLHPRHPTGPPDGGVPRPRPCAADVPRSAVPGVHRCAADDPDLPDRGELRLRRHLDHHRRRRRARHHAPTRGAADVAQLRGLPQVATAAALYGGPTPVKRA